MSAGKGRIPYASHPIVYGLVRYSVAILMRIFYRFQVTGLENVPQEGPTIFAMNHLHLFDPAAAGAAIPRQVVVMAADKWADHWFVRLFLKGAGTIYVRRGEVDRNALRACLQVLNAGGAMALAPEGTRSRTGTLQRGKPGIAYLATRTQAVIVPVACWGVERFRDWKRLKRPTCTVSIGAPFHLAESSGRATTAQLQEYADQVMIHIASLLPEHYRGVYAGLVTPETEEADNVLAAAPAQA
ncbi:MAG: lysophospholipid acyltransferase family protein [Anaerolineae bacterium]